MVWNQGGSGEGGQEMPVLALKPMAMQKLPLLAQRDKVSRLQLLAVVCGAIQPVSLGDKYLRAGHEARKKRREEGEERKERGEMDFKVKRKTNWGKHLQRKTDTHW